jgi:hypothetical protein
MGALLLSGCGAQWWVPYESATPTVAPEAGGEASASAEATEIPPPTSLGATIGELPIRWNEAILPGGAKLPDTIPADSTSEGISTASLFIGDLTVLVQWSEDSGEISFLEMDGPMDAGGLGTSELALTAPGMSAGVLGLESTAAQKFMADAIATSIANAVDPNFISEAIEENGALISIDASDGLARLTVEPVPDF